jgi:cell division protein FtsB
METIMNEIEQADANYNYVNRIEKENEELRQENKELQKRINSMNWEMMRENHRNDIGRMPLKGL